MKMKNISIELIILLSNNLVAYKTINNITKKETIKATKATKAKNFLNK